MGNEDGLINELCHNFAYPIGDENGNKYITNEPQLVHEEKPSESIPASDLPQSETAT
jgi:hypothetical protein